MNVWTPTGTQTLQLSATSSGFLNPALKDELVKDFNNDTMVATFGRDRCVQWIEQILATMASTPVFTVLRVNTLNAGVTPSDALRIIKNIVKHHEAFLHPELPDVIVLNPSTRDDFPKPAKRAEVIVDVKCGSAILRGSHVFTPGVLSAPHDMQVGDEVSVYADAERRCLRGSITRFEGRKIFVGNGTAKTSRRDLFVNQIKHGVAVEMKDSVSPCPSFDEIPDDHLFAQNLPSIVCGYVLGVQAGERILDMCAAPGGKCTHLAALMNNKGVIVALDKTASKIERIKSNCSKLGAKCVHPFAFDATKAWDPMAPTITTSTIGVCGPPYTSGSFDRVLLDAPCSALGQRPQLANRMSVKELHSYPKLQRKLMANAVELVKTEGILVYSTCTFTFLENESVVQWTLKKYPWMELVHQEPHLGEKGFPYFGLKLDESNRLQRYGAQEDITGKRSHDVDTIGFFIAKFVKKLRPSEKLNITYAASPY